jgi:4-amino-4-deoxy-L-arabinose transferase-like glycosyltransferase
MNTFKYLNYLVFILILASLFRFVLIPLNEGLWWDEAVYLGLGKSITQGFYSLDQSYPLETFRPPLFPLLISIVSGSVLFARIFVALISLASIISVYFLAKELYGKEMAMWSSLFLSANYFFIFFSTKVLSEMLFISLFSLSILFFIKHTNKTKSRFMFLAGILAGLAFLTRYLGYVLILGYLLAFIYWIIKTKSRKKTHDFLIFFCALLIVLIPWFLISHSYYENPIGALITNYNVYTVAGNPDIVSSGFFDVPYFWGYAGIFLILGLLFIFKDKNKTGASERFLLLIFSLSLIIFLLLPFKEPRYLLSFISIYSVLMGLGVTRTINLNIAKAIKIFIVAVVFIITITSIYSGFQRTWEDNHAAESLYQASLELKDLSNTDESILSQSYPYVYYLTQRTAIPFCENYIINNEYENCQWELINKIWEPETIPKLLEKYNIRYILVYKFEPTNPDYILNYLNSNPDFRKIKTFKQWGDEEASVIYEFIRH